MLNLRKKTLLAIVLGVVSISSIAAGVLLRQLLAPSEELIAASQVAGKSATVALPNHLEAFELADVNGKVRHLDDGQVRSLSLISGQHGVNPAEKKCHSCKRYVMILSMTVLSFSGLLSTILNP